MSRFINSRSTLLSVLENLDPLVLGSSFAFYDYCAEKFSFSDNFNEQITSSENSEFNDLYKQFLTGFALSPIDKTIFEDINRLNEQHLFYLIPEMQGKRKLDRSTLNSAVNNLWTIVEEIRKEIDYTGYLGKLADLLQKHGQHYAGSPVTIPLSEKLKNKSGSLLLDIFYKKSSFTINFRDLVQFHLYFYLPLFMCVENLDDDKRFDSHSHMVVQFSTYLQN